MAVANLEGNLRTTVKCGLDIVRESMEAHKLKLVSQKTEDVPLAC